MDRWRELNQVDFTILNAISREWRAERMHEARQARMLRGGGGEPASAARWRVLALALLAGLAVALLVGLAVAASGAVPVAVGGLLA